MSIFQVVAHRRDVLKKLLITSIRLTLYIFQVPVSPIWFSEQARTPDTLSLQQDKQCQRLRRPHARTDPQDIKMLWRTHRSRTLAFAPQDVKQRTSPLTFGADGLGLLEAPLFIKFHPASHGRGQDFEDSSPIFIKLLQLQRILQAVWTQSSLIFQAYWRILRLFQWIFVSRPSNRLSQHQFNLQIFSQWILPSMKWSKSYLTSTNSYQTTWTQQILQSTVDQIPSSQQVLVQSAQSFVNKLSLQYVVNHLNRIHCWQLL